MTVRIWEMSKPRAEKISLKNINHGKSHDAQITTNLPATSVATIMLTSCFLNFVITLFLSA